ncbi:MAG: SDR family oxidoreductase [Actinobacteria bacterium]|nr:SDR family oxidoreductase [Actinomycetota bacterium]
MKTLVTGGAGFLGSHLCDYLLKNDHYVICMDNLVTGSSDNLRHIDSDKFIFIKHDITKYIEIDGDLDYIFHFASPASPVDYLRYPIKTLKVGALGTHNVLGLAKAKKARILLASTSEVYGDPKVHPQNEDYWGNVNPVGPRGVYDEAKRFAEAMTMAYHKKHNIETRIARIFNTYGTRMRKDDGRVVPTFVNQALKGEDITVFGDGNQTRSFCHVSDMIEGIYRLMMSDYILPINLGNPDEMTILELANYIKKITNSKSKIVCHPLPENDPKTRKPDISRAKKILEWEPKIGFEKGMEEFIEWFKRIFF